MVKVDSSVSRDWSRVLEAERDENVGWAEQVIGTRDGGYAVTGYRTNGNGFGLWKLTERGRIEWSRTYTRGTGTSLLQTADRGYVVGGTGTGDIRVMSTNSAGEREWSMVYAKDGSRTADMVPARGNGVILVGRYTPRHPAEGIVVKITNT